MSGTYLRLGTTVHDGWRAVVRAAACKLMPQYRRDPAKRPESQLFDRAMLAEHARALAAAFAHLSTATHAAWATGQPEEALANATPYLQAFGHVVIAWVWLDVALCVSAQADPNRDLHLGQLAACRYFFRYELPRVAVWLAVVETRDDSCRRMAEAWF